MGQIDENTPKLKLKISSPNTEDTESAGVSDVLASEGVSEATIVSPASLPVVGITTPEKIANPPVSPVAEEETAPKIKISISSIKSSHKPDPLPTIQENPENTTHTSSTLNTSSAEIAPNRDISSEKKESTDFLSVEKNEIPLDGVFKNYSSDFDKKSMSFIERVRSIGKAPKTRIGLVLGMIVISGIGIASLTIIAPEKHSLSIYKTNILYLYQTKFGNTSSIEVPLENIVQTPPDTIVLGTGETQQGGSGVSLDREEIKQQKLRDFLKSKQ